MTRFEIDKFDLSPLFSSSVGFDHFSDMIERAMSDTNFQKSYPPYNIEKLSETDYRITMAIAGFSKNELEVSLEKSTLTISGNSQMADESENGEFLHRGIAGRTFQRKFNLAEHMKITEASLKDGLLKIYVHREIPKEEQAIKIDIKSDDGENSRRIAK